REPVARRLDTLDRAASRCREDSELRLLERSPRGVRRVSRELFACVRASLWAAKVTGGRVDPTLTSGGWRAVVADPAERTLHLPCGLDLDFGASGKALAADRLACDIRRTTGSPVLVSLGGDIAVAGGRSWPVGVADDHAAAAPDVHQVVSITGGGLAPSA